MTVKCLNGGEKTDIIVLAQFANKYTNRAGADPYGRLLLFVHAVSFENMAERRRYKNMCSRFHNSCFRRPLG